MCFDNEPADFQNNAKHDFSTNLLNTLDGLHSLSLREAILY